MPSYVEIRELSERDKGCLECTLIAPQCNKKEPGCVFAQITRPQAARHTPEARARATETRMRNKHLSRDERTELYNQRKRELALARYHANKPPSREERRKGLTVTKINGRSVKGVEK